MPRIARCFALILICFLAAGCGKSEQQQRDEQAAEDARWDAAVAAAEAERQKEEQRLTDKEVARLTGRDGSHTPPPNPAVRPSGWAVATSGVTKQNMDDAVAAVEESLRVASLDRVKTQELAGWERFLPGGAGAMPIFRDAHWNIAQTAICGEVDFSWLPPDGSKQTRTGYRKFVLGSTVRQTVAYGKKDSHVGFWVGIDIDRRFRSFGKQYDDIMAVTDCTPDPEH